MMLDLVRATGVPVALRIADVEDEAATDAEAAAVALGWSQFASLPHDEAF
jgi:hypothetical protein